MSYKLSQQNQKTKIKIIFKTISLIFSPQFYGILID